MQTEFEIWDSDDPDDRAKWERTWSEIAAGDPFCHPAYVELLAGSGERALCAWLSTEAGTQISYAFLLRPIHNDASGTPVEPGAYDIYTPLSYGGPLSNVAEGPPESVVEEFWDELRTWAWYSRVVSEFIRMSPAAAQLPYPGTVTEQAPHVVRTLGSGDEDIVWMDMSKSIRRGVRKARRAGMTIEIDEVGDRLDDFLGIYYRTMERRGAADQFYYSRRFFETIHRVFPGRFAYVYAMLDGEPVSTELMLLADTIGHSFLGGTESNALPLGSNAFLSYESFTWLQRRGFRKHILGGGVANTVDDSLLKFKRLLAPNGFRTYLTGQQIFDRERYAQLACGAEQGSFFPSYRDPRIRQRLAGTDSCAGGVR